MRALTRRLMILLLCCWLPLQAVAAMALECHLVAASSSAHQELSLPAPTGEHSGCGGNVASPTALHMADTPDSSPACDHCQFSCYTAQLFLTVSGAESLAPVSQTPSSYALPLPQTVFIASPQRPPQAV